MPLYGHWASPHPQELARQGGAQTSVFFEAPWVIPMCSLAESLWVKRQWVVVFLLFLVASRGFFLLWKSLFRKGLRLFWILFPLKFTLDIGIPSQCHALSYLFYTDLYKIRAPESPPASHVSGDGTLQEGVRLSRSAWILRGHTAWTPVLVLSIFVASNQAASRCLSFLICNGDISSLFHVYLF